MTNDVVISEEDVVSQTKWQDRVRPALQPALVAATTAAVLFANTSATSKDPNIQLPDDAGNSNTKDLVAQSSQPNTHYGPYFDNQPPISIANQSSSNKSNAKELSNHAVASNVANEHIVSDQDRTRAIDISKFPKDVKTRKEAPKSKMTLDEFIGKISDATGLSTSFLNKLCHHESGCKNIPNSAGSKYGGYFQIPYGHLLTLEEQFKPTLALFKEKIDTLGRKPTDDEMALMWQQGATGAKRLLEDPSALAKDKVGYGAVFDNLAGNSSKDPTVVAITKKVADSITAGKFAEYVIDYYNGKAPDPKEYIEMPVTADYPTMLASPAIKSPTPKNTILFNPSLLVAPKPAPKAPKFNTSEITSPPPARNDFVPLIPATTIAEPLPTKLPALEPSATPSPEPTTEPSADPNIEQTLPAPTISPSSPPVRIDAGRGR
jgi:hypothetical protein